MWLMVVRVLLGLPVAGWYSFGGCVADGVEGVTVEGGG